VKEEEEEEEGEEKEARMWNSRSKERAIPARRWSLAIFFLEF